MQEFYLQGLLEVHDEVAAHIQNSLEEVKYIDGVSSGEEDEIEEANDNQQDNKVSIKLNLEKLLHWFLPWVLKNILLL